MIELNPKEPSLKIWVEAILFISSYLPLFLILMIRDISKDPNGDHMLFETEYSVSSTALGFFLITAVLTLIVNFIMRRLLGYHEGGHEVHLYKAEPIRGDMINYTLPFLIGLFAFDYKTWQSITSLIVFLGFMFAFLRKDGGILLNPMLMLIGVKLHRIEYKRISAQEGPAQTESVLCMGNIKAPSTVPVVLHKQAGIGFLHPEKQ